MSTGAAAIFGIICGFIILFAILCIAIYNKLHLLRSALHSLFPEIEGKLRRQCDLLPALVKTAGDFVPREEPLLNEVSQSCAKALQALSPAAKAEAGHTMREALKRLFIALEAYPELQARTDFIELRNEMKGIGDSAERAWKRYNLISLDYNAIVDSFPSSILASLFRFERAEFLEPQDQAGGRRS
ncbi:MAG TPA: LemA family protein [Dissulfurispiraceae bacterium]